MKHPVRVFCIGQNEAIENVWGGEVREGKPATGEALIGFPGNKKEWLDQRAGRIVHVAWLIAILLHHVSSAAIELGPQFAIERSLKKSRDIRLLGRFKSTFAPIFSISG